MKPTNQEIAMAFEIVKAVVILWLMGMTLACCGACVS